MEETETLKQNLADMKQRIQQMEGNFTAGFRDKTHQAKATIEGKTKENPFGMLGMAYGAGVTTGLIFAAFMRRK